MTTISKDFTRGSQVTFHYLRMFIQSLKRIILICLIIFILSAIYYLYRHVDHYLLRISLFFKYLLAGIYHIQIPFIGSLSGKPISFEDYYGSINNVTASNYMAWYKESILPNQIFAVKQAFKYAFKVSIYFFFAVSFGLYLKGLKQHRKQHLRGMRIISSFKLKFRIILYNLKKFHFKKYKIANIPYPKDAYYKHTLLTGASGSGKTQAMNELIECIRKNGDRAIIYDRTGGYIRKFHTEQDILLNPFDKRNAGWSIFNEGKHRTDFDLIASILIEESKGDPFWYRTPRMLFSETCQSLLKENKPDTGELLNILLKSPLAEFHKYLLKFDTYSSSAVDPKSKGTAQSLRSVLSSYLNCLQFTLDQGDFSIRKWIQNPDQNNFLFLSSSASKHSTLKPLLTLWLDIAINGMSDLDQEQDRKIWFIIDELPSLQYLPSLDDGIAETRQFGGCFVISTQSMARLRSVYGQDKTESISSNCSNRLIFSTPNAQTAEWCAKDLGSKEILANKESISFGANEIRDGVSASETKELESLVIPSQIMGLKDLEFYVKMSKGFDIAKSKLKYKKRPDISPKLILKEEVTNNIIEPVTRKSKKPKSKTETPKVEDGYADNLVKNFESESQNLESDNNKTEYNIIENKDEVSVQATEDFKEEDFEEVKIAETEDDFDEEDFEDGLSNKANSFY